MGAGLSFGGGRAAYGTSDPTAPRAHTRGREVAADAVRWRVPCLLQPHVAADSPNLLESERATAESHVEGKFVHASLWLSRAKRTLIKYG